MRVVIYGRVSRDHRQLGRSVEEQIGECLAWADREGWQVVKTIKETASASRFARVGRQFWLEVLDTIRAGEADALLTWEASRATRDITAYAELRNICTSANVQWGYSGRLYDLADRDSRFRTGLDALLAEDEAARTSERIKRAVRHAALAGRVHGKNLYGYRRVYDDATRALLRVEPDPDQAPVVCEAARRVLAGDTLYQIAKSFNQRNLAPRRNAYKEHRQRLGWTAVAIKQMLIQPAYAGLRQHNGEIVAEATWPPLIKRDDFDKIRAILFDPARGRLRNDTAVHLLSGIARCSVCGGQMRVGLQNDGKPVSAPDGRRVQPKYHTYICQGVPGKGGFHTAIKCSFLDDMVVEAVISRLERPDVAELLAGPNDARAEQRTQLRTEIEGYRTWLEQVRERAMREQNLELLFDQETRTQPLIDAAQRKLNRLADLDPAVAELVGHPQPREEWEKLSLAGRRQVIVALVQPRVSRAETRGQRSPESVLKRVELVWH
jgi:site-specific DNA recombinase